MIHGDAVLEAMRSAGVLRDVSPDGAGALARRIGRVVQSVRPHGRAQFRVDDAGFDDREPIRRSDVEHAIQSRQHDQHTSGIRKRTTRQTGAGPSRYEGHVVGRQQAHDGHELFSSARQNDEIRHAPVRREAIHRVGHTLGTSGANVTLTNDRGQIASKVGERGHAIY